MLHSGLSFEDFSAAIVLIVFGVRPIRYRQLPQRMNPVSNRDKWSWFAINDMKG